MFYLIISIVFGIFAVIALVAGVLPSLPELLQNPWQVGRTRRQRGLDHVSQPVGHLVGRLEGLGLDHHPDQGLGSGRPQQYPA